MSLARSLLVALLVLPALVLPAAASAATPPTTPELLAAAEQRGDVSSDRANLYLAYAFGDADRIPRTYRSDSAWDGTLVLLQLRRKVRAMPAGRTRERIEDQISAQHSPTTCFDSTSALTNSSDNSDFFHVDYGTIGGGLDIGDYEASLDASWNTEVTTFGWAAPPVLTSNAPPGNRYHVRVDTLDDGLYGFVSNSGTHAGNVGNNLNTAWNEGDAFASCMVLDDDYSAFGDAQAALDATTAHEFNHAIQYGYGALTGPNDPDFIFAEGGATWMEDEVHDAANDSYNYLWPDFTDSMGAYEDTLPFSQQFPYPYWITFRGLTERFGTGTAGGGEQVMQDFWELVSQNQSAATDLASLNQALVNKGTTLAQAFHDYAIAVKFNRTCGGGYVLPYCFEEAAGYLAAAGPTLVHRTIGSVGGTALGSVEDNYASNWVALPISATAYRVTLQNTSAGGALRGTVVCNSGSTLLRSPLPSVVGTGGTQSIGGFSTSGCSAPVLVITNEAQTAPNPATSAARSYTVSTAFSSSTSALTISRTGSGSGTVTSTPAGISCGLDCAESYANGTTVTLTATPAVGSAFGGWSGACTGTGPCVVSMTAAQDVTATFNPVSGGGGEVVQPPAPPPPPDVLAPALTRLRLSVSAFRAAPFGPSIASSVGTRVRFRLSEQARVTFRVRRKTIRRRVAGRCRATTRLNRNRPRCVRWVRVRGSFAVTRRAGARSFVFRGRIGGRRLRLGVYRLAGRARDADGNASPVKRVSFRIVRR